MRGGREKGWDVGQLEKSATTWLSGCWWAPGPVVQGEADRWFLVGQGLCPAFLLRSPHTLYNKYLAGGWANLTNQHSMGVDLGATSTSISRLLRPQEGGRGHLCQGGLLGALPGVWDEIGG